MKYSEVDETLAHTEKDDKEFDHRLEHDYPMRPCEYVGTIGTLEVVNRRYPYGYVYFFLHDGKPVGTAIVKRGGRTNDQEADWHGVTVIYLQKPYRQKGLGTEFYKLLISQGHKLKPDSLQTAGGEGMWKSLRRKGLAEDFMYPVGKAPDTVIDYRKPEAAVAGFRPYNDEQLAYFKSDDYTKRFGNNDSKGYDHKVPSTNVILTTDGKVIVFFWGSNDNTIEWKELLQIVHSKMDKTLQDGDFDIQVKDNGYAIRKFRGETGSWSGDRTKYSLDLKTLIQTLVDRKIATPKTPLWFNMGREFEPIGTVGQILKASATPNELTLYHGTSSFRYHHIQKYGLKALPIENRIWNKGGLDKERPEHREDSVYLTASLAQAQYYAKKAVNIDRKRNGPSKRQDAYNLTQRLEAMIPQLEWNKQQVIKNPDELAKDYHNYRAPQKRPPVDYYDKQIADIKTRLEKLKPLNSGYYGDMKPVILQVTLGKSDYKKLLADDDYLRNKYPEMTERNQHARDWRDSLSQFGQIAFQGIISPEHLKVIE